MNKKRLTGSVVALGLAALVAVGGSLAWFTDTESKSNTFQTGKIDIALTEDGLTTGQTGLTFENVMPGDALDKVVRIDNLEQEAWVRLKVTITDLTDEQANQLVFKDLSGSVVNLTFVNHVAYTTQVKMAEKTATVTPQIVPFATVTVPTTWNNNMSNKTFHIDVEAQAIQTANNPNGFTGVSETDIIVAQ